MYYSIVRKLLHRLFIGEFTWKRVVRAIILIPILVYLGIFAIAWLLPNKLMFRPPPSSYQDDARILRLLTSDGETIAARFYENQTAKHTILFSHGNAEDLGSIEPFILKLRDSGFAVFTYDYRGYGTSDGSPDERKALLDIEAAFDYLTDVRNIPRDHIILHGRSLGGGPSVQLASRERVGGLILESSFTSVARVLTDWRIFPFDYFDNITRIGLVNCPVLVIHGKQDWTIPFRHGQQLFEAANEPKSALWVDNAGHNNLFRLVPERYLTSINEFADTLTTQKENP